MRHIIFIFLPVFMMVMSSITLHAQLSPIQDSLFVTIEMKDGSKFVGRQLSITDTHVVIETTGAGKITLKRSEIDSIKEIKSYSIVDGEYWHESPNGSRNFFGPTGYNLRAGEGYYQNWMLVINQFSIGFTDHFTLGFAFEIVTPLVGLEQGIPGFMITPKYAFPIKQNKWNVGIGSLILHAPGSKKFMDFGLFYGISTFGSRDQNVSVGLGFGVADGEFSSTPTITFSGNYRSTKRFALISENYILPTKNKTVVLLTFGGRYIGDRITWDFSFLATITGGSDGGFIPIPLVGALIPFSAKSGEKN